MEQTYSPAIETWRPKYNPWWICIAVMLVTIIEVLDTTITSVAVPSIAGNLGVTSHEGTWVVTSYLVSNAIILPATAWLSSFFGRKRFLMMCILIFTGASLLCGISASFGFLLFSLVLQGIGGGALQPISQAILLESFPKEKRELAMAIYAMGVIVFPIFGPILGGWLTDNLSWRWIFFLNIPIGLLSLVLVKTLIEDPPYLKKGNSSMIDYIGFGLMAIGLATLQIILDKGQTADWFQAPWICWSAILVVVSLTAFVLWELRQSSPVVNLRILKDKNLQAGLVVTLLLGAIIYGVMTIVPFYYQTLMGYSAYLSGVAETSTGIGAFLAALIIGRLSAKVSGKFFLVMGLCITTAASFLLMATINLQMGIWSASLALFILGFGVATAFVPLATLALGTLSNEDMGNGSGLFNLMRNIGGSVGIAFVTTIVSRMGQAHQAMLISHLTPYDPLCQIAVKTQGQMAYGLMYKGLLQQSNLLAYIDVFFRIGVIALCCIPFVFLFRQVKNTGVKIMH